MRDIREDLSERLSEADADMAAAKANYDAARRSLDAEYASLIEEISAKQQAITRILNSETIRVGAPTLRRVGHPATTMRLPLVDYILYFVTDHERTKDEIKDAVDRAGYEGAGRSVHTTLLNMVRSGKLSQDGDLYKVSGLGALFGNPNIGNEEGSPEQSGEP